MASEATANSDLTSFFSPPHVRCLDEALHIWFVFSELRSSGSETASYGSYTLDQEQTTLNTESLYDQKTARL